MYFRHMQAYDAPQIVEMLRKLRVESPEYNYVQDDPITVTNKLDQLLYKDIMQGVVAHEFGEIVGFMMGFIAAPWYSTRVEAMEQLLYVEPMFRGGSVAPRLIRKFECLCKERNAYELHVGASTGLNEHRTVKLYEKMGYTKGSPTLKKVL